MAKASNGNLFLKHVEKLVLAVCLVILVAMVLSYPMSQPTVPLDNQKMAPDKVDAYLVKLVDDMGKARRRSRCRRSRITWPSWKSSRPPICCPMPAMPCRTWPFRAPGSGRKRAGPCLENTR